MAGGCMLFLRRPPRGMLVNKLPALQHHATSALHISQVSGTKNVFVRKIKRVFETLTLRLLRIFWG